MSRPLRVATHLAPSVLPLYRHIAEVMASRLGRVAAFEVATGYERCGADIDDVCFVCSVPYLLVEASGTIRMEPLAAPVLAGDRYGGRPVYFSDVIVPRDSPFQALEDLRGGTWAYNEPFSHSGYVTVWHELVRTGKGRGFFGRMVEAGFHQEALRMVADGRVDGAAIDSQVLAIELAEHPELGERVRVVGAIGPSTIQPVVASASRLSPEERQALLDALLTLGDSPEGRGLMDGAVVDRFVPVDSAAYDDVRGMLARVQEAGMLGPDWQSRWARESGLERGGGSGPGLD
jgi:phosphonate transport system substrate-binding protein